MKDAGLLVSVDAAGNLIGSLGHSDAPLLMIGSHSDTVLSGGRFDGIVGLVAALEVVRSLRDANIALCSRLEVVDFVCEEPTLPHLSPLGSRIMAGDINKAEVRNASTPTGESLRDAIMALGGSPEDLEKATRSPGQITGYLELHIEQGRVLEENGFPIGVVTVVAAPCRALVQIIGSADHAGATSMRERRDALAAAAEITLGIERIMSSADLIEESVGTVGFLRVSPNMVNVIPGMVEMSIEIRSTSAQSLSWAMESIEGTIESIAKQRSVEIAVDWNHLEDPVTIPPLMREVIAQTCEDLGIRSYPLPSRASHDAARLAPIAPVGMIFIPCLNGRSHCPEEFASIGDIVTGTTVLGQSLLKLDQAQS